jgi:acyl carrier protein
MRRDRMSACAAGGWRGERMKAEEAQDELKAILIARLKFDPRRAAEMPVDTPLPKGVDGGLGLDSLDFIELSIAIEERFGLALDESEDLAPHFASLGTLARFIVARLEGE